MAKKESGNKSVAENELGALGKGMEEVEGRMFDLSKGKKKKKSEKEELAEDGYEMGKAETDELIVEAEDGEHIGEKNKGKVEEVDDILFRVDENAKYKDNEEKDDGE